MKLSLLSLLLIVSTLCAQAQDMRKVPLCFKENRGQVTDQNGNHRNDIDFVTATQKGLSVFVGKGQVHYQWSRKISGSGFKKHRHDIKALGIDTTPTVYHMYRMDMTLIGANPMSTPVYAEPTAYYENYHTTALNSGNHPVSTCTRVTYPEIYPHIDWTLYIKRDKLEYDFIIKPGGKPADIQIKYDGANSIAQNDGNVTMATPMGSITERKLYAYDQNSKQAVPVSFTLSDGKMGFAMAKNFGNKTIIIDPELAWGTYYGGVSEDGARCVACDNGGNVVIAGITQSQSNIATTGAYDIIYHGGFGDGFVTKFSPDGNPIWGTYYGGNKQDIIWGIACDRNSNVIAVGVTSSKTNIATGGAHQDTLGGMEDGFITKFDPNGGLLWASYCGGSEPDELVSVTTDSSSIIYATGAAASRNLISTPGSYQDSLSDSLHGAAILLKYSQGGTLLWGTYFNRQNGVSDGYSCICDPQQNIYMSGQVTRDGIFTTPGCFMDTNSGISGSGYIAKFDAACHLLWSTYFAGDSFVYIGGIICDSGNNLYLNGETNSHNGISSPGAYQSAYGGGYYDGFLAKFNASGTRQWATYYGGANSDGLSGTMYIDRNQSLYVNGGTGSSNNIATTDGWRTNLVGSSNGLLAKFSLSGDLQWGTYYGGIGETGFNGLAGDNSGIVYAAGETFCTDFISTPDSYQPLYTDSLDAFLLKINASNTGVINNLKSLNQFTVFPDPNNGTFTLNADYPVETEKAELTITDMAGRCVWAGAVDAANGHVCKTVNIGTQAKGLYLLQLSTGGLKQSTKFVIANE